MRVFKVFFAACVAFWSLPTLSQASIIVSIDMDLATAGIQSTNSALIGIGIGDSFTAGLVMQTTAPTTLGSYNYSVSFGNSLFMTGRTETSFGSLNPIDNSNPINNVTGRAFRFDGADFGQGQLTPLGPVQVGTLTFNVLGATNTNIVAGRFEPAFDLFFAADGVTDLTSTASFNAGTLNVTAVPEPASVILSTLGLFGVWFSRRRMRKKAVKQLTQND